MRNEMRFPILLFTAIFMPLLTSCGGGGTQVAEGGIGGTGISMGKVSGFGSLYVNSVKYEIDNADFVYEGHTAPSVGDDSGIKVGMVVRLTGSTEDGITGQADIVEYAKLLKGSISSNLIATNETGTLEAMGQIITVDSDTIYDDGGSFTELSQLPDGAVIEVSGFSDGNGKILATRIETISLSYAGEILEVKGIVSSLSDIPNTFKLGTLTIDYANISLPSGVTNGIYVEVKGDLSSISSNRLDAIEIEIEGDGDLAIAEDGEEAELEGIITDIISLSPPNAEFVVNGQKVMADTSTTYESGGDASNITLDQPLEVEGIMDGVILFASKIKFEVSAADKEELKAVVEEVNTTENTFTLLGQVIKVTSSTIYEDERDEDKYFNLVSLSPDDYVEVDLYEQEDGALVATKLERDSFDTLSEIDGVVDSVEDNSIIHVVNITVDITALTGFNPVIGQRVEIKGTYDDLAGVLTATSGEIELPDDD